MLDSKWTINRVIQKWQQNILTISIINLYKNRAVTTFDHVIIAPV